MSDEKTTAVVAVDNSITALDSAEESDVLNAIAKCKDRFELQKQLELFQLHQAKRNALRAVKMDGCLESIEDQIAKRVKERPDEISNTDLLKYLEAISNHVDRATDILEDAADSNKINRVIQNNDVTINLGTDLTRDNKENVVNAMKAILGLLNNPNPSVPTVDINPTQPHQVEVVEEVKIDPVPIIEVLEEEE